MLAQVVTSLVLLGVVSGASTGQSAALTALSGANTAFSQSLYQQLGRDKTEVVYSPYSIHAVLSMTSLGARGDTSSEMLTALGVSSMTSLADTYHSLIGQLNSASNVKLYTGNGIFMNPRWPIEADFVDAATKKYEAKTENIDFAADGGPEKPINDYIAANTNNMIKNVVPGGSITGDTVMLLVNTIFFNGTWAETFDEYKTRPQTFNQLGGASSQVDMMQDDRFVMYKRDAALHTDVIELPFKGNRFALYIALPHAVDGITALENSLAGSVDSLFQGLSSKHLNVEIPKFKIESTLPLNSALQAIGIKKAFEAGGADFSGISQVSNVYISSVLHKAVIEVKETGTTAAAATVVQMVALSMLMPSNESFRADHPFLFFLRDNQTGQILFQGKYSG